MDLEFHTSGFKIWYAQVFEDNDLFMMRYNLLVDKLYRVNRELNELLKAVISRLDSY